jgi:hypothetical protein
LNDLTVNKTGVKQWLKSTAEYQLKGLSLRLRAYDW